MTHDRERWERHPNIHGLAGMLLSIHDGFRSAAKRIREQLSGDEALTHIRRGFQPLASTLHHHHRIEEAVLFPMVARTTGQAPTELVDEHLVLMHAITRVEQSLLEEDRSLVQQAVAEFDARLRDHLEREETLMIPFLLETNQSELFQLLYGR